MVKRIQILVGMLFVAMLIVTGCESIDVLEYGKDISLK